MKLRAVALAGLATAVGLVTAGCGADGGGRGDGVPVAHASALPQPGRPARSTTPSPTQTPSATSAPVAKRPAASRTGGALAALATLHVKGRAPRTGYSREQFGQAWADVNRNGCDTRSDILGAYLTDKVERPGTHGCVVESGTLDDPYSGRSIHMVRGDGSVQVDHVVPLGDAWVTGAARWPAAKRVAFANDPVNLLPVDSSANESKGDGDAATWLPPNHAYRCRYVARQVRVKAKYGLWVTPAEKGAISRILTACPGQTLPKDSGAPTRAPAAFVPQPTPAHAPKPTAPRTSATTTGGGSAYYANCAAARAAGVAPLHTGDPGYSSKLDRDGDGIACE